MPRKVVRDHSQIERPSDEQVLKLHKQGVEWYNIRERYGLNPSQLDSIKRRLAKKGLIEYTGKDIKKEVKP